MLPENINYPRPKLSVGGKGGRERERGREVRVNERGRSRGGEGERRKINGKIVVLNEWEYVENKYCLH